MKKALIDVKRINNSDVIATSGCSVSDFSKYSVLFQSNENSSKHGIYWSLDSLNNACYRYDGTNWNEVNDDVICYYGSTPTLTSGKWYHVCDSDQYCTTGSGDIVECTDPNHHGVSSN